MKKNIPLLKRLRTRFLRMRHPKHFDMTDVATRNECGTAMCIGGHALDLQGYRVRFDGDGSPIWFRPGGRRLGGGPTDRPLAAARREMGLKKSESTDYDTGLFFDFSIKTPEQAAKRIEQLIAEG